MQLLHSRCAGRYDLRSRYLLFRLKHLFSIYHLMWHTLTIFLRSSRSASSSGKRFVTHIQLTVSVFSSHPIPSQTWDLFVVVLSDTITLTFLPDASAWDKLFRECRLENCMHAMAVIIFIVLIRGFIRLSAIEANFLKRLKCLEEYFIIILNIFFLFTKKSFKINTSYFLKDLFYFKEPLY